MLQVLFLLGLVGTVELITNGSRTGVAGRPRGGLFVVERRGGGSLTPTLAIYHSHRFVSRIEE